jgi:hypothetical protein
MKLDTAVDGYRGPIRNLVIENRRRASAGVSDLAAAWVHEQRLSLPNVAAIHVRYREATRLG